MQYQVSIQMLNSTSSEHILATLRAYNTSSTVAQQVAALTCSIEGNYSINMSASPLFEAKMRSAGVGTPFGSNYLSAYQY